ncbi:hypothetical protein [Aquimarina hainanensis]
MESGLLLDIIEVMNIVQPAMKGIKPAAKFHFQLFISLCCVVDFFILLI